MNGYHSLATLDLMTDSILIWIGQALLWGTLLALLTWALVRIMSGRVRPAVHVALWTIVLVKFLIPFGPASSFSFASIGERLTQAMPRSLVGQSTIDQGELRDFADLSSVAGKDGSVESVQRSTLFRPAIIQWTVLLYAGAVLCFVAGRLRRYGRVVREYKILPPAGALIAQMVDRIRRKMGVRRSPSVRLTQRDCSPFVFGIWKPTLVLPQSALHDQAQLEAILLHEMAHLRRGDMLVRVLQWLAGTTLFFWPVVAWINRQMDLARESACDEWALRHGRIESGAYARCLLRFAQPDRSHGTAGVVCAMASNPRNVERRIDMILDRKFVSRLTPSAGICSVGIVVAWSLFCLTSSAAGVAKEPGGGSNAQAHEGMIQRVHLAHAENSGTFAEAYPTADVDGDGTASPIEQHAFFIAKAMLDPDAVLDQYPWLDQDGDGQLTTEEINQVMHGGHVVKLRPMNGDQPTGAAQAVVVRKVEPDQDVVLAPVAAGDVAVGTYQMAGDIHDAKMMAHWLMQNIVDTPTLDEVQAVLTTLEQAQSAELMKRHPDTDFDGDGFISQNEITHFKLLQSKEVRGMILKMHPEIDADGDGQLSDEELVAFKKMIVEHHRGD